MRAVRTVIVLLVAVVAAALAGTGTLVGVAGAADAAAPAAYRHVDRDCGDFASQAAAQRYYLSLGGPAQDPDRLDSDGDGIACETLPCPCSTNEGGGGGGGQQGGTGSSQPGTRRQRAVVVDVVDGDTIDVRFRRSGPRVRVRLLGIDTPEVYGGTECWGPAASSATKRMLPVGTHVLLVSDPTQDLKDRYGRILRYVMKHGHDVDRALVARGDARVYVYQHHPFKRVRSYRTAQASAQRAGRGLWGHC
jgi:endonuclease YncB( thermonuclease family)